LAVATIVLCCQQINQSGSEFHYSFGHENYNLPEIAAVPYPATNLHPPTTPDVSNDGCSKISAALCVNASLVSCTTASRSVPSIWSPYSFIHS